MPKYKIPNGYSAGDLIDSESLIEVGGPWRPAAGQRYWTIAFVRGGFIVNQYKYGAMPFEVDLVNGNLAFETEHEAKVCVEMLGDVVHRMAVARTNGRSYHGKKPSVVSHEMEDAIIAEVHGSAGGFDGWGSTLQFSPMPKKNDGFLRRHFG